MEYKKIIDLSLPIYEGMITYPKNPEVKISRVETGTSFLSALSFGSHTGTHVDVPGHVFEDGKGLGDIPLRTFIGPCRVLDMTHVEECVRVENLEPCVIQAEERILVKTQNSLHGFSQFYNDYIYLEGDAADYLADKGIILFGIDYLSVKKQGGSDQRPHTSLLAKGIVIFEGLDLSGVEAGEYTFIGLPVRLQVPDGAPARAMLLA